MKMKKTRITLYIIVLVYTASMYLFHTDFLLKREIFYFLIGVMILFDIIIPNIIYKSKSEKTPNK
jgi:hypothetical protein